MAGHLLYFLLLGSSMFAVLSTHRTPDKSVLTTSVFLLRLPFVRFVVYELALPVAVCVFARPHTLSTCQQPNNNYTFLPCALGSQVPFVLDQKLFL